MSNLIGIHGGFVINSNDNKNITQEQLDKFMDDILELIENNGWSFGGGFHLTDVNQNKCNVCGEW